MKSLFAAAALVLAAALSGCRSLTTDTYRVGSYNIRLATGDRGTPNAWPHRCEELIALIRRMDLDAFGLQEVRPEQARFLRERLPEFAFVGDHRAADRVSDEASPVFYRRSRFAPEKSGTFWLSETPDVPGRKGWGAMCPRVCSYLVLRDKASGRRFCFANAHTDHASALAREKGMLLVIDRMKSFGAGAPIVFVGDHNCREDEAPAVAVRRILSDALHQSETPPRGSWRTYNGWEWREAERSAAAALREPMAARNAPGAAWGPRIDYIYVSPGVRVLDYETVNAPRPGTTLYPSDHFPVIATIALPPAVGGSENLVK